ncbi:protein TSSC4 [Spea bombifrons]|uniref:protein TSSC4 n=1 Tax=Spea bombifrons TaxID=233779 RepID=UPI00234927E5|nr:protein TSSC4 [Spea bombifrons]XP_053304490.1 protein TSSC4 [Spea bombifrons]
MSDPDGEDNPPKPFSAFAYEANPDTDALTLSDSDPGLSDDDDEDDGVAYHSAEEEEEEEDEVENEREGVQNPSVLPFSLKGTNATFSQRSQDIFGGLKEVQMLVPTGQVVGSEKCQSSSSDEETTEAPKQLEKGDTQGIAQSESTSAGRAGLVSQREKPMVPPSRLPDYLAHPERWTKYSLEDVPTSSDRSNRNTALSFLADLQKKKDVKVVLPDPNSLSFNQDSSSSGKGRILFSRPNKASRGGAEKSESHTNQLKTSKTWEEEENSEAAGEKNENTILGFHGVKKRSRKNIRLKNELSDEENSP